MMSDEPQVKNPQLIHLMHLLRADQNGIRLWCC